MSSATKAFGTSPEFWINLQTGYDLAVADKAVIDAIDPIGEAAAA